MSKRVILLLSVVFLVSCSSLRTFSSNLESHCIPNNNSFFNSSTKIWSGSTFLSESALEEELFRNNLEEKIGLLEQSKATSADYEVYCFFTDPHLFQETNDYTFDTEMWEKWFHALKEGYTFSQSEYVVCGGDLLTRNDTISQACYKLSFFKGYMENSFPKYYYLVGNHDTNYQGDTYISQNDPVSCRLSQSTINDLMFDGGNSYYFFDTKTTRHYCFDSGIDWDARTINEYRLEQIDWFANNLLANEKQHITIFIHASLFMTELTAMMQKIGTIISAFNSKETVSVQNNTYDYSTATGHIDYVQAGHEHADINSYTCGGVPIIITRPFGWSDSTERPTFDIVFADYSNSLLKCLRIGDGEDRTIAF